VTTQLVLSERRAVASGFIKQCDTTLEGIVDGLCRAEDLATAENLIPVPSDPEQTNFFSNVFLKERRPAP